MALKWHIIKSNPLFMSPYECVATHATEEAAKQDLAERDQTGFDQFWIMDSERWARQWYVAHLTERGRARRRNKLFKQLGGTPLFLQQ